VQVEVGEVLEVFANPAHQGGAIFILYAATWQSGEPACGDDSDGAGFFPRTELPPTVFASTDVAIARWPAPVDR
jgi:ADP-ribose pyrophosphatase YjhB (NUDIX family)